MNPLPFYGGSLRAQRVLVSLHMGLSALLSLIHWGHYAGLRLLIPHAIIFAWLIYAPDMVRLSALFVIGLSMDALANLPLGVSFGTYWLLWWLTLGQRSFLAGQRFPLGWFSFFVTVALVEFLRTGAVSTFSQATPSWSLLCYDLFIAALLYPLLALHVRNMAFRLKQWA
jgi:cell shape-determining protein MreD